MKTLLVFEDSSRVGLGGGQKMTLLTCDVLRDSFQFRFVDFADKSRFSDAIRERFPHSDYINVGHADLQSCGRYRAWLRSLWQMRHFLKDIRTMMDGLDASKTVAYVTNKRSLAYAYSINRRYGIPFIYHAHLVENPGGLYYSLFMKWARKADTIFCVSQLVKAAVMLPQAELLYNPTVNDRGKKILALKKPFVVAYIGSLISVKGVEFFIDAAKMCPDSIEFRIYGEGALRDELERRSGGRVRFMGYVQDIVGEEYADIDLVIVPTVIMEALSLVVVDAKSVGLPVIVTSPGGQAEIVQDGIDGFHVPARDAAAIAEKIKLLSSDTSLYSKMASASFDSSKLFSFERYAEEVKKRFQKL